LIIPELAPRVVVETDHEQIEIARRADAAAICCFSWSNTG
jgi:hypothetical protein